MKESKVENLLGDTIKCREYQLSEFYRDGWTLIAVDDHIAYLVRDVPSAASEGRE